MEINMTWEYLSQEHVVGLVLSRHEHDGYPVEELQALERSHPHVQEHSEQHRHGDVTEDRGDGHRETDHQKYQDVRNALLPVKQYILMLNVYFGQ